MPVYSGQSNGRLNSCDAGIQSVFRFVVLHRDNIILCGHRGEAEQTAAVAAGASKAPWPTSLHNKVPSLAVDAAPFYPEVPAGGVDWRTDAELLEAAKKQDWPAVRAILENIKRWHNFAGYVQGVGEVMGVPLTWGGDWNGDSRFSDEKLVDLPHFQLAGAPSK